MTMLDIFPLASQISNVQGISLTVDFSNVQYISSSWHSLNVCRESEGTWRFFKNVLLRVHNSLSTARICAVHHRASTCLWTACGCPHRTRDCLRGFSNEKKARIANWSPYCFLGTCSSNTRVLNDWWFQVFKWSDWLTFTLNTWRTVRCLKPLRSVHQLRSNPPYGRHLLQQKIQVHLRTPQITAGKSSACKSG